MNLKELNNVSDVCFASENWAVVSTSDGRKGVININGEFVIDLMPCETLFESAGNFFTADNKVCYDARTGQKIPFHILFAGQDGQYVFRGEPGTPTEFKFGVCDTDFNIVIEAIYDGICNKAGKDRYLAQLPGGNWSFIDKYGKSLGYEVDDVNFATLGQDSISVCRNGEWFIIDHSFKRLTNGRYASLQNFGRSGLAIFSRDGKHGLIDKDENVVMTTEYSIRWCSQDTLVFSSNFDGDDLKRNKSTWGLMDMTGNILLTEEYTNYLYWPLTDRIRLTDRNGKKGYVSSQGQVIIPFIYDSILFHHRLGVYSCSKGGKWGILDCNGKELIPIEYDSISINYALCLEKISVTKDGRAYFINSKQEEVNL